MPVDTAVELEGFSLHRTRIGFLCTLLFGTYGPQPPFCSRSLSTCAWCIAWSWLSPGSQDAQDAVSAQKKEQNKQERKRGYREWGSSTSLSRRPPNGPTTLRCNSDLPTVVVLAREVGRSSLTLSMMYGFATLQMTLRTGLHNRPRPRKRHLLERHLSLRVQSSADGVGISRILEEHCSNTTVCDCWMQYLSSCIAYCPSLTEIL